MTLEKALADNYMTVHDTGNESNQRLDALFDVMGDYFNSERYKQQAKTHYGWFRLADMKRKDNIRLGTWCLRSVGTKRPRVLIPNKHDPRSDDGSGAYYARETAMSERGPATLISHRPLALMVPFKSRKVIESYLNSVLNAELSAINDAALTAGKASHYRAIVSVDYYSSRSLTANGAHKDTVGNTLFVALHYRNPERMAGPEYIIDRWPIPASKGFVDHFTTALRADRRTSAPWARSDDVPGTYWPKKLLFALEKARKSIAADHPQVIFESSVLNRCGLVSFVDELVYHLTPLREHRKTGSSYDQFNQVGIAPQQSFEIIPGLPGLIRQADIVKRSGNWFGFGPRWETYELSPQSQQRKPISRRMSTDLSAWQKPPSTTGGLQIRQFLRLWISIVPSRWYSEVNGTV